MPDSNPDDDDALRIALSNCAREPIHIPGRVQAFGALMAFDLQSEVITHGSTNLAEMIGSEKPLLGIRLKDALEHRELVHDLRGTIGLPTIQTQRERLGSYQLNHAIVDVAVHRSNDLIVVELERHDYPSERPDIAIAQVRSLLGCLRKEHGYIDLIRSAAAALRRLTGYDRVMGYRFLSDGAGEVMAEELAPGLQPFFGLRYPASDIPDQVRAAMLKMPFRCISDIHADPVDLLSLPDQPPLDMTLAHLKGVSPIHVEYLKNMGVRCTMNLPIINRGELWGLFALHHYRPKLLSPQLRSVCELFGQFFSMEVQQELEREELSRRRRASSLQRSFTQLESGTSRIQQVIELTGRDLMEIVDADGVAILTPDQWVGVGSVPSNDAILKSLPAPMDELLAIDSFSSLGLHELTTATDGHALAGMLSLSISTADASKLIFFRVEETSRVRWAGEPQKRFDYGPNGPRLSPRASFQEYVEIVSGRSRPWQSSEVAAASEFRTALADAMFHESIASSGHWRRQKEYQDLLIAELNHRVKNILALVRSIARQTKVGAQSLTQYTENFERRIAALSTAHDLAGGSGLQWVALEKLLEIELRPYSTEAVHWQGPVVSLKSDVAPVLALVMHELLTNAVKYGALSEPDGRLAIQWQVLSGGLELIWKERLAHSITMPSDSGFGMSLIRRAIPHECGGEAMVEFGRDGLRARFWLPSDAVRFSSTETASLRTVPTIVTEIDRIAIDQALIVENNLILSMELEKIMLSLGCQHVSCAADAEQARLLVEHESFQIAVLDIHLGSGTSLQLAEHLQRLGLPLVFLSGYGDQLTIPESLHKAPRLSKPVQREQLAAAIRSVIHQEN